MKTLVFFVIPLLISSCISNRNEKTIKGRYSIEVNSDESLGDSSIVEGHILDRTDQSPILFSTIQIHETKIGKFTDSLGYFKLKIPLGIYSFKATGTGYSDLITKKISINKSKNRIKITFQLGTHIIYD